MWNGFRLFFLAALSVAVCSLATRGADDPKKDENSKAVQFDTVDGVTLDGRFYPRRRPGQVQGGHRTPFAQHQRQNRRQQQSAGMGRPSEAAAEQWLLGP